MVDFKKLLLEVKDRTIKPNEAGRLFFGENFSRQEHKEFLSVYLDERRYDELALAVFGSPFSGNTSIKSTGSKQKQTNLDVRFFYLLQDLIEKAGIEKDKFYALCVAVFYAPSKNVLVKWIDGVKEYLRQEAKSNFDSVLTFLTVNDPKYLAYDALLLTNRQKTESVLLDRLLYGDGNIINKAAIRKLLLKHEIDFSCLFSVDYKAQEAKLREAMVRLALLYKNESSCKEFLQKVAIGETNARIRDLIDVTKARRGKEDKKGGEENEAGINLDTKVSKPKTKNESSDAQIIEEMQYNMIHSIKMITPQFHHRLQDSSFALVASSLFFSVYREGSLVDVIVVEDGQTNNLNNQPIEISKECLIGVLHPSQLPKSLSYLTSSSVKQPFSQIRRPFFVSKGHEVATNKIERFNGTLVLQDFKALLKNNGFRLLFEEDTTVVSRAVLNLGQEACVVEFTPSDFSQKVHSVSIGSAKFYGVQDFIVVLGKWYLKGVPSKKISDISPVYFSEFLYALYKIAGKVL
ncbi:MAG: DUF4132 domain-containing protein [Firmicutes bacterium]|nr:DUF4132 domain-containing protein [Bacillota bacterium]